MNSIRNRFSRAALARFALPLLVMAGSCGAAYGWNYLTPLTNLVVCPGDTAVFSATASGPLPYKYQWYKNGATITGKTNNTLTLLNVAAADAATYSLKLTGGYDSVTNSATLTVRTNLSATPLTSLVRFVGANALFSTTPSGFGPFGFQWTKNGTALAGKTASSLLLTNLTLADSGTYAVIVSDACHSITNKATLMVDACFPAVDVMLVLDRSGSMTGKPYNDARLACSNFVSNLHLTTNADQAGLASYNTSATLDQKLTNSSVALNNAISLLPGPNGNTSISSGLQTGQAELVSVRHNPLAVPVLVLLSDGLPTGTDTPSNALYQATLAKNAGTLVFTVGLGTGVDGNLMAGIASSPLDYYYTTNSAQLSTLFNAISTIICRPPTNIFLTGLSNLTVCAGSSATFHVTASGCSSFTYQWKKNGLVLPGQTNSSLVFPSAALTDAALYTVEVGSQCSSATNSATLTVNQNVLVTCPPASLTNCTGSTATFTVTATGTSLAYQWYKGTTLLTGKTSSSLALTNVTQADAGTYSVVVSGACGAPVTNSASLTVTAVPNIICPVNKTVQAGSPWTFDTPSANYPIIVVNTVTNPAGQCTFTATRTWQAADACGNSAQCSQAVTVQDTTAPVLICPTNLVLNADAGQCSKSNVTFVVTATDNCGSATVVTVPPSGSTFPVGTTTVTSTATDTRGNTNTCTFTVTVKDTEKPVLLCPTNMVLVADAGHCSKSDVTFVVGASENCGSVSVVSVPPSGSTFPVGTTIVTNTATDSHGNTNFCTFTVTVNDTEKPVLLCPTNMVLVADAGQCSKSNVTFVVGASENCGSVSVVSVPPSGSTFPVGTTIVTNTATDNHGNTSVCTFTVTVNDAEKPALLCPTNMVLVADAGRCSKSNVTFVVGASENCGSVSVVSLPPSGSTFPVGTTIVTNTATDNHGNTSVCTFIVTVNDTEKPVLLCPTNMVLVADAGECSKSNVTFVVGASENCGSVSVVSVPPSGSTFPVGTTIVTNTATDNHGNTSVCTFIVTVNDTEKPVLLCPTNMVLVADAGQCSKSNVTFVVGASENCGSVNVVSVPPSGSTFPVGTTIITNTATDNHGNTSVCTFTVTVNDTEKPVLLCPTNMVLVADAGRCSKSNVTFVVGASENCGSVNVVSVPPSGSTFPVGTTIITNTATDSHGNTSVCTFTVTVNDTEKPVLLCPTNMVLVADAGQCSKSNVTFVVGASENCGSVSVVSVPPSGSTFPVGTTIVTNTATDSHGNTSGCTFTVTVNDTEKPVLLCPTNMVLVADAGQCSKSNVTFVVGASENCGSVSVVSVPPSGSTFPVGTTTVANTATDSHGNTSVCTFTVTVNDTEKPVLLCPTNMVLVADAGQCSKSNVTFVVGASENCGSVSVVSVPPSGSTFPVGTTIITNTATDSHGNTSVCTFTVTVNDTEKPVLLCPTNMVLVADAGQCSKSNVTFVVGASENCGSVSVVSVPPSGSTFPVGTTTVTNTATDSHGNTSVCTFTVTISDKQPPVIVCSTNKIVQVGDTWQFDPPLAYDNCGSASITVFDTVTNLGCGHSFIATRTWRATDASGNTSDCSQFVSVVDHTAPFVAITSPTNGTVFLEPANIHIQADARDTNGFIAKVEFFLGTTTNKLGEATNGAPYFFDWTNVPAGSYTLIATATDACGNMATSAPVNISVIRFLPLAVNGPIIYNPQSGFWDQKVQIFNPTLSTLPAVGVFVYDLPAGWNVQNPTFFTNGVPVVLYNQPLGPGATSGVLTISYRENGNTNAMPTLLAMAMEPGGTATAVGSPVHISRAHFLADGSFLLNFATVSNATYFVLYSSDLVTWTTSPLSVSGTGSSAQWIDYGPPATDTVPSAQKARFYRVVKTP